MMQIARKDAKSQRIEILIILDCIQATIYSITLKQTEILYAHHPIFHLISHHKKQDHAKQNLLLFSTPLPVFLFKRTEES